MKYIFLISLILIIANFSNAQQPDTGDEINVETSIVVVPFKVSDRNNKNLSGLKQEDFQVFENDVEQEIASFDDAFAPFTIALALDVSDSTTFQLNDIKRAAVAFLKELRPDDRLIIYTFDNRLNKIADLKNNDLANAQNSIAFSPAGGKTSVYDAVGKIIGEDFKKISGKKALIIFTDGIDTASVRESYASSLRTAQEAGVLTFPIQYDTTVDARKKFGDNVQIVTSNGEPLSVAYKRATQYLELLSSETGGDFYFADSVKNLENRFSKIVRQLSQIYSLSYYKSDDQASGKRRIKIKTKTLQAVVQTRKTYYLNDSKKKRN